MCRFNFAEFRSRSFSFVPATVLLHLPFVYFKVRKRGERMVGETHIFFSLRVLLYSPQLPHERHFCLAVKYIALHLLLMRFALLFFSFCRKTLNLSARLADFIPSRLTENLRGSVSVQSLNGKGGPRGSKYNLLYGSFNGFHAIQNSAVVCCKL